jgi:hypothetical protein
VSPRTGLQGQLAVDVDGDGSDELANWSPTTHTWIVK